MMNRTHIISAGVMPEFISIFELTKVVPQMIATEMATICQIRDLFLVVPAIPRLTDVFHDDLLDGLVSGRGEVAFIQGVLWNHCVLAVVEY